MQIILHRTDRTADATLGVMIFPSGEQYFTLEPLHPIAVGEYAIIINFSPKFQRLMPLLTGVTGHEGIRIHIGNTSKDTSDCILVGIARLQDSLVDSKHAFNQIFPKIAGALQIGKVTIQIKEIA